MIIKIREIGRWWVWPYKPFKLDKKKTRDGHFVIQTDGIKWSDLYARVNVVIVRPRQDLPYLRYGRPARIMGRSKRDRAVLDWRRMRRDSGAVDWRGRPVRWRQAGE